MIKPISSKGTGALVLFGTVFVSLESFIRPCTGANGWLIAVTVAAWLTARPGRARAPTATPGLVDTTGCWRLRLGAMPMRLDEVMRLMSETMRPEGHAPDCFSGDVSRRLK